MKRAFLFLLAMGWALAARAAETETLTLRLTQAFDAAWDRGDQAALCAMFDVDCVYKTPFRTEHGRDALNEHVFKRNLAKFHDTVSTEDYSHVEGDLAYATGTTTFNEYDKDGKVKAQWVTHYLHIFTRRPGEDWKLRFHCVHEETQPKK